MLVTSFHQKGQSSPILHKPANSSLNRKAQGFTQILISQGNSQNISLEESSPTSKVLLKIKPNDRRSEPAHQTRRPQTSLKARPSQGEFSRTHHVSIDDKRKILMSAIDESSVHVISSSQTRKVIKPVIGVHIYKRTSDTTDQFTKIDMPDSSEIANLKFGGTNSNFFKDVSPIYKRESLRNNKPFEMSLIQEKRLNHMKAAMLKEKSEYEARAGYNNRSSYSPERSTEKTACEIQTIKRISLKNTQSLIESEKANPEPENQEADVAQETANRDIPKEGSLLKYFNKVNKTNKFCKSTLTFRRTERASTETSPSHIRPSCNSPSIDTKRNILTSTLASTRGFSRSNTVARQRTQKSQGVIISKGRASASCHTSRIESSLIENKTQIEEKTENTQYIATFVNKVQGFLKDKYEADQCWVQGISNRNNETERKEQGKILGRQRGNSTPQKGALQDSNDLNSPTGSSPLKTANTTFAKGLPIEQASRSLFEQSSTQLESSIKIRSGRGRQKTVTHGLGSDKDYVKSQTSNIGLENSDIANSEIIVNLVSQAAGNKEDKNNEDAVSVEINKTVCADIKKQDPIPTTINGLLKYARCKSQEIEDYMLGNAKGGAVSSRYKFQQSLNLATVIDLRGGVLKRSLNLNNPESKSFRVERAQIQDVYKEIDKLEETLREERKLNDKLYAAREAALEKAVTVRPGHLSQKELEFVRYYFQTSGREDSLFPKLDNMLSRLRFYSLLAPEARAQFYKHGKYAKFPAGSYVFQEGDFGDLMYVILKGSVNVKAKRTLETGESQVITLVSLYDGSHFGDLAMVVRNKDDPNQKASPEMKKIVFTKSQLELEEAKGEESDSDATPKSSKIMTGRESSAQSQVLNEPTSQEKAIPSYMLQQKRSASIECVEECEMLMLEREKYQTVVSEIMNRDMGTRIKLLNLIPFFKGMDMLGLVPFATNLRKLSFKFGQRIIKEGDPLMNFYIILKGKCHVVKEIVEDCRIGRDHYASKLRYLKFKDFEKTSLNKETDPSRLSTEGQVSQRSSVLEKLVDSAAGDDPSQKEALRKKLRPFNFRSLEEAINHFKKLEMPADPNERAFNNDRIKDEKSKAASNFGRPSYMAKNHAIFTELTVGNFFGFRPLFRRESDTKYKEMTESKARLSVIASTVDVEVYILTRDSLAYLPEGIKNILVESVEKMQDFDDCDINEGVNNYSEWKKFKVNLAKEVFNKPDPNLEKMKDFYKAY